MIDVRRVRLRNDKIVGIGLVVYWMQRDQRVQDNWAFLYAQECAKKANVPMMVVFNLAPQFGDTSFRHYAFMLKGLEEVEKECEALNIPFVLLQGAPDITIPNFVQMQNIGHVVTDFNPLRFADVWREKVAKKIPVQFSEVDAHNIIPAWVASPKEEFAAYTFRPKIHKILGEYLKTFPKVVAQGKKKENISEKINWVSLLASIQTNKATAPITWITPGTRSAKKSLKDFIENRLDDYATKRNDPNENHLSHLSPYLHFGQLCAQRIALEVQNAESNRESKDAYLEELIVRRELADNYCFYNTNYDKVLGAHAWAQKSIGEHKADVREFLYTKKEFEEAKTHDPLWNAAQLQMVKEGKMHGFMRMYWAKKILEWTKDVQQAIDIALYLNDKYELDGTDPNGVVGVMWSVCGVHDRAWTSRPVFGKIRYMNYSGCKRKFNIVQYIAKYGEEKTLF